MAEDKQDQESQQAPVSGLINVLKELVSRLQSQPFLFGIGALLLLVIAGSLAADSLSALRIPAIIIFVFGILAWLVVEIYRISFASRKRDSHIRINATDVGKTGRVTGVEGLPESNAPPKVDLNIEDINGDVAGARYRKGRKRK